MSTAQRLRDENERLKLENERLQSENEKLRKFLKKCNPVYFSPEFECNCKGEFECAFCGQEEHTADCEYVKLTGGA